MSKRKYGGGSYFIVINQDSYLTERHMSIKESKQILLTIHHTLYGFLLLSVFSICNE